MGLSLLLLLPACAKTGDTSAVGDALSPGTALASTVGQSRPADPAGISRKMILCKGNNWIAGVSGFGENCFSALSGGYRLEGPDRIGDSPDVDFQVDVTREPLYFSGEWQPRPAAGNVSVYQCAGEDGFCVAVIMEDSDGIHWAAVFRFPNGLEEAGLSEAVFSQMLRAWTGRFLYFLSLSKDNSDLSLPAVLDF